MAQTDFPSAKMYPGADDRMSTGRIHYFREIVRSRFSHGEHLLMGIVHDALGRGSNIEEIIRFAKEARDWTQLKHWLAELVILDRASN